LIKDPKIVAELLRYGSLPTTAANPGSKGERVGFASDPRGNMARLVEEHWDELLRYGR